MTIDAKTQGLPEKIAERLGDEGYLANGRHVEFHFNDKHIAAGLLRDLDTKEVFKWPANLECMYCGESPAILAKP